MTITPDRLAGHRGVSGKAPPRHAGERRRQSRRAWVPLGVLLVTVGLVVIGYVGWQLFGTNLVSRQHQAAAREDIRAGWDVHGTDGDATADEWRAGDGIALVRIPRFGRDYEMPLLVDPTDANLARGIAWFSGTARPGQVGNFAIAAHRVTHGEPFSKFLELRAGDEVVVETRTHVYTYRLSEDGDARVVDFSEGWVLDPVPGKPDAVPHEAVITLVTCAEIFHTDDRNVVFGALQTAERK